MSKEHGESKSGTDIIGVVEGRIRGIDAEMDKLLDCAECRLITTEKAEAVKRYSEAMAVLCHAWADMYHSVLGSSR